MAHQKRRFACDPPHEAASLSAVLAHAHECAPRAPRHRPTIARRLETDLPFLPSLVARVVRAEGVFVAGDVPDGGEVAADCGHVS